MNDKVNHPEKTFKEFLESILPDTYVTLIDLPYVDDRGFTRPPDIFSYCENEQCSGERIFASRDTISSARKWSSQFLDYTCRNCTSKVIRFALRIGIEQAPSPSFPGKACCVKFGQSPAFGPRTPTRLITLIGPDRDLFLQGRKCENRGLGIGAFAYYRRVVENQKNRIISEIEKVAKLVGFTPQASDLFAAALKENQFTKSVELVKGLIPQALLINGQNPLTLLHSALSKGLHDPEMTDAHCLELAQSVRVILGEIAERAAEALRNDKEIQSALSVLRTAQKVVPVLAESNVSRLTKPDAS